MSGQPSVLYVHSVKHPHSLALAETRPAHWVIVLHLGLEGCSQPRELWFVDILMYSCFSSTWIHVMNTRKLLHTILFQDVHTPSVIIVHVHSAGSHIYD